jgi:WXG100 family type VII secretion target
MLPSDAGGGYTIPGDPAALRAAARLLDGVATTLGDVQSRTTSSAASLDGSWTGNAASAFHGAVHTAAQGFTTVTSGTAAASRALVAYAQVLETAQQQAAQANTMTASALGAHRVAIANLPSGGHAAQQAQQTVDNALSDATSRATTLFTHAETDVRNAARVAAAVLHGASDEVAGSSFHDLADTLGGPGTALALLGLEQQGWSWTKLYSVWNAARTSDLDKLARANPAEWRKVQQIADEFGEGDMRALAGKLKYESSTLDELFGESKAAAVPLGDVPAGAGAGTLDVLGKIGFGLAIVGDADTLFFNKDASGTDKAMAGANLGGIALAEGGESVAGVLLASDAAAAAVPVVGEVIIAGTAVYFATEWTVQHWDDIKRWSGDALHGIEHAGEWTSHELGAVNTWAQHTISDGATGALHTAEHIGSGLAHTVDSDLNTAKHVLSDLNPF